MNAPAWLTSERFACLDVETTGLSIDDDRIVQIAVVQIDGGAITSAWRSLVNPGRAIPAEATAVHGITDDLVADRPPFAELAVDVMRRCARRVLVTYNGASFDVPFVRAEMRRAGQPVGDREPIDVLVWVREIDRYTRGKGRHRLATACARWGVEVGQAHDALSDSLATWALFRALVERLPERFPLTIDELLARQAEMARVQDAEFQAWLAKQPAADTKAG